MIFADTHAHIYLEEFDQDRNEVLKKAYEAGVHHIFLPNIDSSTVTSLRACKSSPRQQETGMRHEATGTDQPATYNLMGLHPGSVNNNFHEELRCIEQELINNRQQYCGIGEIGIDLYWDKTYRAEQEEVFRRQLDLAIHYDLPVVIHTRNSFDIAADIIDLKRSHSLKGIFHCFSGNLEQAVRAINLGFLLGIGGVITYKNSGLQQVVEQISLDHLVLETDSPYLPPVPYRGRRNEPGYIPLIAEKIAEIKNTNIENVAHSTTVNAMKIFQIWKTS